MHSGFMSLRRRDILHARSVAAGMDAERPGARHPDASLLDACSAFNALERRKIRMLKANEGEDLGFELALGRLCIEQEGCLERMCETRATTMRGHRARALAFALWDGGDLTYRVKVAATTEDMMLLALIRDLTRGGDPV